MSKKIIIANWKMNFSAPAAKKVIDDFMTLFKQPDNITVVICPGFTAINYVAEKITKTGLAWGAQNCYWEEYGAFTGEVSPRDLAGLGCRYVIVGHSERRTNLNESDAMVNNKVTAALAAGLTPIVCVGETFAERQEGTKEFVIMNQVNRAIAGVNLSGEKRLIIAYEPVWVIGSGQAVEPVEAGHTHQVIRQVLIDKFEAKVVEEKIKIIYGGSVDFTNINKFLDMPCIDGALVGGASLDPNNFVKLIQAAAKA